MLGENALTFSPSAIKTRIRRLPVYRILGNKTQFIGGQTLFLVSKTARKDQEQSLTPSPFQKPKWRHCVAASIAVGSSAILTGSRTRPSDWGWSGRFGPVEDLRNNHRLVTVACVIWILQIWWLSPSPLLVAVTFTSASYL